VDVAGLQFKAGDALYGAFPCRSVDQLSVLGSNGRVYSTAVAGLPGGRGDGQPITTLIELESGTTPAHYIAGPAEQTLLLAGTGGFGLLARVGDLATRQKGGKAFVALEAGENLLPPSLVAVGASAGALKVACLTLTGRLLTFGLDELKLQPNGGRGLTLIDLEPKDALVSVAVFRQAVQVLGTGRGGKPKEELLRGAALTAHAGKRARKGRALEATMKAMRVVVAD
jgi:topoisomerase IV subunit A